MSILESATDADNGFKNKGQKVHKVEMFYLYEEKKEILHRWPREDSNLHPLRTQTIS